MTRAEKWLVWSSTAAVAGTGFVLGAMKYLLQPTDPWAVINHPLQPIVLKLHILTAPFLVFGIGAIAMRHIWPHFRAGIRRGRRTGILTAAVTLPMVLTGYLIQAVTHVGWLRAFVIAHLVTGTLFTLGALPHALATRRSRTTRRPPPETTGYGDGNGYGNVPLSTPRHRTSGRKPRSFT